MGNVVEEQKRKEAMRLGLDPLELKKFQKTKTFIESQGVYRILYRNIKHLLTVDKKVDFELKMEGGSYTDGQKIVVSAIRYIWGEDDNIVFSVLKALTGHETEHIESSDFNLFIKFQYMIAKNFGEYMNTGNLENQYKMIRYNKNKVIQLMNSLRGYERYGVKLGSHLLNSVEDGRIEKRLCNRMRGFTKHIKFMNGVIWDNQPVDGQNPLQEFLFCITSVCVTGLKSKNWENIYGGTDLDQLIDEIRPLIIKGINQPSPKGCAETTFEIYLKIAPKIAELLKQQQDAMDGMSDDLNFSSSGGGQSSNEPIGNDVSTHFKPEDSGESDNQQENQGQNGEGQNQQSSNSDGQQNGQNQQENESNSDQQNNNQSSTKGNQNRRGNKNNENNAQDSNKSEQNGESNSSNKKDKSKTDENDVTDKSLENAKNEKDLVKEFLKDVSKELKHETKKDLEAIKKEEEKIKKEEERKLAESGNLSQTEINDVLIGERINKFSQKTLPVNNTKLPEEIVLAGKNLRRKLEKILLDKQSYTSRNRRRGVLDTNSLWKLGIKDRNVFMKKGQPDDSSYVVSILVDNSGSMTDYVTDYKRKFEYAKKACAILEEGLKGLVPFRIAQFDYRHSYGVRHLIVSDFGDTEKENRTWSTSRDIGGANADSISIRIATAELIKRPETKKILFVLSDGLPSAYRTDKEAISSVREAIRDARKAGIIVIGIHFGSEWEIEHNRNSYQQMYQKGIIRTEPQNIPMHLIKVLEREIK